MRFSCAVLLIFTLGAASFAQPTPDVVETLVNFDAVKGGELPAQDLELELPRLPYCGVRDWYKGPMSWGLHPRMHYIDRKLPTVEIDWTDPFRPIRPGERRHFGIALDPAAPPIIPALAWWSAKVRPVSFPWQRWEVGKGRVVGITYLAEEAPRGVRIAREYAVLDRAVPLDDLTWEGLNGLEWTRVEGDPIPIDPGADSFFDVFFDPNPITAVLVRFTVGGDVDLRVIHELVLEIAPTGGPPSVADVLTNFDIHNSTDAAYEDFELHLMCLQPSDVIGWYEGALGWGRPARIDQIPGGTEVLWADPFKPWRPSQTYHFGLRLRPGAPPPIVTASWTAKLPIPVPWQGWTVQASPNFFEVIDEIALSPLAPEPVRVRRQFSVMGEQIPLSKLNWDLVADWKEVVGDPVRLGPGDRIRLAIPVGQETAAALVRYEVSRERDPVPVARFVNEALLAPGFFGPILAGSLSNFDLLNLTKGPVHDLELWLPGIRKEWVLDWYDGPGAWGIHPGEFRIPAIDGANPPPFTEILWKDPFDPVLPGALFHFGVAIDPAWMVPGPREARAWWSVKVAWIPLPWQWWGIDAARQAVVDAIRNTSEELVYVRRDAAVRAAPVVLDELIWEAPVDWQPIDRQPVPIPPGQTLELTLPLLSPNMAALVRYEVFPNPQLPPESRVVNEAVIRAGRLALALVNFDVHNATDFRVADLELDLFGIDPDEVVDWYRGDRAWGNPPRISQIPRGTEVMWADPYDPLRHCQWRHFGIALRPEAMEVDSLAGLVDVRAGWTIKVSIPLPWQTWRPEPGRVVDVIQASPVLEGPVRIRREYASLPAAVPLDALTWDLPDIPWKPVPDDPVSVDPGKVIELPVEVDPSVEGVLVRYEAEDGRGNKVRVVNEAIIRIPPPACPCVSELRCDRGADGKVALAWKAHCWNVTYIFTVDGAPVTPITQGPDSAVIQIDPPCGAHTICVIAVLPTGETCDPVCCRVRLRPCFIRADTDGNGGITIGDGIQILMRLFVDLQAFGSNCDKTGDFDDDGVLTIADAISVFNLLFANGRDPSPPYPRCGGDPTEDPLTCEGPVPACP